MKPKEPRVLQLIDSLDTGGAERVSVNLANAISEAGMQSFLCATRKSGPLEQFIDPTVKTLGLHKKSSLDPKAIYRLVKFIRLHKINIIHAHATSFFMAVLCKPFTGVKIVWHDHSGFRDKSNNAVLVKLSHFFDAVVVVNKTLLEWSKNNLYVKNEKILFLQNFAQLPEEHSQPELPGSKETRIVCLANLRWQKDHLTLLKAFQTVVQTHPEWQLLLVGQDKEDAYSQTIKTYITTHKLNDNVHILGARSDTADILGSCSIGVLSSESEGLPVALLEYGLAKLPVVCTDVGQIADVLGHGSYGNVVDAKDSDALAKGLLALVEDERHRTALALGFHEHVQKHYSKEAVVKVLVGVYKKVLNV